MQQVIRAFQNSATLPPEIFFGTASSFTTAGSTTTASTTAPPASTQERNIQLIQFSTPGSGSPEAAARQETDNSAALNSPNDVFLNDLEENEEQEELFNESTTAGKSRQTDDADDIAEGFTLSYDVSGEKSEEDRGGERRR